MPDEQAPEGDQGQALGSWLDAARPAGGLSPAQERVFDAVRRNQQLASYSDISAIALRAGVDNSTVVRFAQSLGFRGWPSLQQELRGRYLAGLTNEQALEVHAPGSPGVVHDAIRHDVDNLRAALDTVDPVSASAAVAALVDADRILAIGQGSFAGPATIFAHLAATMGFRATLEARGGPHLATAVAGLSPSDALLLVNPWRPIRDLHDAATAARSAGATVVAVTDVQKGLIASVSDVAVIVPSEGVSFFQSVTAITSVVYGLLAGMQAERPEETRQAIQAVQRVWRRIGTYADEPPR